MTSIKHRVYYSEKEKVYAIQEIKDKIIALECDVTKMHQNLKNIGREISYLYVAMAVSSESSSSESSSSESDYEPWKATNFAKPGNKKAKPRRNPTRFCRKIESAKLSSNG